ncbi:MAG TPA: isopentenyl phosphate kinase [Anaerolineales bacterium]|nr:isopentenyl phosphate kinase [Anaerolineales bacterium]
MSELVFLKLGGSLITDKTQPYTVRLNTLARLAEEIKSALARAEGLSLVLGHGSGSFGHYAVKEYMTPLPPNVLHLGGDEEGGRSFSEVWYRASQLNRYVIEALHKAEISVMSLPASALVSTLGGSITKWDLTSIKSALHAGIIPVIYGDVVFDDRMGASILSTEHLMFYLAHHMQPQRILLAGLEAAVWADFPARQQRVREVTRASYDSISGKIGGSHGTDVTGGMKTKVEEMLLLVEDLPEMTVQVFSGEEEGNLEKVLMGEHLGTLIKSDD